MINRHTIIQLCEQEMGVFENPPKSNKTKYGEWYGMNGVFWCAIWVAYIFWKSSNPLRIDKWKKDTGGFHYVPTLYAKALYHGWLTDTPQAGDICLMDFDPNDRKKFSQHVGIYSGQQDAKMNFIIYEGNTSSGLKGSQNNGDGTFKKPRQKQFILGFVDIEKMFTYYDSKK